MPLATQLALALAIVTGSFVSEDAAVLSAAVLAATRVLDTKLALISAIAGVTLGDYGLFVIARLAGRGAVRWNWTRRLIRSEAVAACRSWCERHARPALFISRAVPGTRLPMTLACGLFGMPAPQFVLISVAGASTWVLLAYAVISSAHARGRSSPWTTLAIALIATVAIAHLVRLVLPRLVRMLRKYSRWEFWPAWVFYLPVALMYLRLAVRYRSFTLPALSNPGQLNGGIIGESKAQILDDLSAAAPGYVAEAFLIDGDDNSWRRQRVVSLVDTGRLSFPFVLKPNVGQRGAGFRVVHNLEEVFSYLQTVRAPVVAQRFVRGPHEAGIFYFRLPDHARGEILGITDKVFPVVTGDGRSTLEELIRSDERASLIAKTYLDRFHRERERHAIVPAGTRIQLVEAGNHCQGCIFRDGFRLYSEELHSVIDRISQSIPGFFIGRYDVRYSSVAELQAGRFTIIELNGASSEVTSIYDPRTPLMHAYRMLYRQWSLVFEIADVNRRRGLRPPSPWSLWHAWREYAKIAAAYPFAH